VLHASARSPTETVHPLRVGGAAHRASHRDEGGDVTATLEPDSQELPLEDQAFHIEQHGVDYIPRSERWATPRDIAGLWAGASINIEYFIYGAILMGFGFSFWQAMSIIIIGNLSWFLVGLCSLQGPVTGTTVFGTNRAAFGPQGSKFPAFFNWLTQLGFEVEGLILIVGAALVLVSKAGFQAGDPMKIVLVLAAVGIQIILPLLGHPTMVKVLKALIIPFGIVFLILYGFAAVHAHPGVKAQPYVDWQLWTAGLAFTIPLSGLGWTECGNDYSRYLDEDASKGKIVGWLFLGTAIPEIIMMTLGALVFTFIGSAEVWHGANPFEAFLHQSVIPGWLVVIFMLFTIVQLFGINSLDLYSSGVTLQALGLRLKRYQAVLLDSVIAMAVTFYAVFNSSFSGYLKDFVDLVIIWIAPWCAIYLVDWMMRRYRYAPGELQKTGKTSIYWANGGVNWSAIIAMLLGMIGAMSALNTTFHVPHWMNPITYATGSEWTGAGLSGADFSVFMGLFVGGLAYFILASATGVVKKQVALQDELATAR
jgi:purine-cytosine permease-like protein